MPIGQLWNSDIGGLGTGRMSADHRKKLSEAAKCRLARPGEKERLRQAGLKFKTPENSKRFRELAIKRNANSAYKDNLRRKQKDNWLDPKRAAKMKAGLDRGRKSPRSARAQCKALGQT